ncbi:MAG: SRPBCC family protein [Candidatus Eremiobacteraeota bacterium]|nr:SRPBCC family protein [Candidatus Eremiobacteraeota bacterium]
MKTYGVCRSTTASPATVWQVWSDPNNWSRWNSGIHEAELDGPLANGVHGKMTTNRGTTHDITFHDVHDGRGFSLSMAGPPLTTITFKCEISPENGGSTIAQGVSITGPLAFLFGPMMGNQMAKHFVPVLDDLARSAESQTTA